MEQCSICLEELDKTLHKEALIKCKQCNHLVHTDCIVQFGKLTCPLCRGELDTTNIEPEVLNVIQEVGAQRNEERSDEELLQFLRQRGMGNLGNLGGNVEGIQFFIIGRPINIPENSGFAEIQEFYSGRPLTFGNPFQRLFMNLQHQLHSLEEAVFNAQGMEMQNEDEEEEDNEEEEDDEEKEEEEDDEEKEEEEDRDEKEEKEKEDK